MSVALTWVQYNTATPFTVSEKSVPILECGTADVETWSAKQVFGLRWIGGGATNIKLWLDGDIADIYNALSPYEVYLREDLSSLGYEFKYTLIDDETLDDTVFNQSPSTWDAMPISSTSAIQLGTALVTQAGDAYSQRIGFAIYQPDTSALSSPLEPILSNLRFLVEFDELDE